MCRRRVAIAILYVYRGSPSAWSLTTTTFHVEPSIDNAMFSNLGKQVATYMDQIIITGDDWYEGSSSGGEKLQNRV
jgi:hypothetical protein